MTGARPAAMPAVLPDVLSWLARPRTDRGIDFGAAGGRWSYARLAGAATDIAAGLRDVAGTVVGVVAATCPQTVAALYGALIAGAAVAPLPAPPTLGGWAAYRQRLDELIVAAAPAIVLLPDSVVGRGRRWHGPGPAAAVMRAVAEVAADGQARPAAAPGVGRLALAQLTSGSQGPPRPVHIGWPALDANVAAIARWLRMAPTDRVGSWLPLFHDMGLVGILLTTVSRQLDLRLMAPDEFIRDPGRWLRLFDAGGATLTASPTFALRYLLRRLRTVDLTGLDLSAWRALIVGAEYVDPAVLDDFTERLAAQGFQRRALLPAYGLAEATVAVTGSALDVAPRLRDVDPDTVVPGRPVRFVPAGSPGALRLVGCGRALGGMRVRVVDATGAALPDGHVGEIEVAGPSLADNAPVQAGRLATGDAGMVADGELFVLGRFGDAVKVHGRYLFAETVEAQAVAAGARAERTAVLLGVHRGEPVAVLLLESAARATTDAAVTAIRPLVEGLRLVVAPVPVGTIARTSSGKPRRRLLWQHYTGGALPAGQDSPL